MRFKSSIKNISIFTKLTASLSSLCKIAWVRLDNDQVRFTIIPEQGTQVWAVLAIDTIFEDYTIQSASPTNEINLEVPLLPFHRALRSALNATSASIRLTKKDNIPLLSLTILTSTLSHPTYPPNNTHNGAPPSETSAREGSDISFHAAALTLPHDRETTITQDIPIRVLNASSVSTLHEPTCPPPDVHIMLPPLLSLKALSERFTKLSLSSVSKSASTNTATAKAPRLTLSANMHGEFRMGLETDALKIESRWQGLQNPELDPEQVEGGEEGVREHPSTKMREIRGEGEWAVVRVEGRDWGRVLGVGRLGGKVIACFCHEHALILYVYVINVESGAEDSVMTYYITSYSE